MNGRQCTYDGCSRRHYAKGWCKRHYDRVSRYGKPDLPTFADRFWDKADRDGEGCWEWHGAMHPVGYGSSWNQRLQRVDVAHRVAWELTHGPLGPDEVIRHRCDNPPCVNPDHLEFGTREENMGDAVQRGRIAHGRRAGSARLDETSVAAIRRMWSTGAFTQSQLSEWFDTSQSNVSHIVRGLTWNRPERGAA